MTGTRSRKEETHLENKTYIKNALLEIFMLFSWKLYKIQFHSGIT